MGENNDNILSDKSGEMKLGQMNCTNELVREKHAKITGTLGPVLGDLEEPMATALILQNISNSGESGKCSPYDVKYQINQAAMVVP